MENAFDCIFETRLFAGYLNSKDLNFLALAGKHMERFRFKINRLCLVPSSRREQDVLGSAQQIVKQFLPNRNGFTVVQGLPFTLVQSMQACQLTPTLEHLTTIFIPHNDGAILFQTLHRFTNLITLKLHFSRGIANLSLKKLTRLRELVIETPFIILKSLDGAEEGVVRACVEAPRTLNSLSLKHVELCPTAALRIAESLRMMPRLKKPNIDFTAIPSDAACALTAALAQMPLLRHLSLQKAHLNMLKLPPLPQLTTVNLSHNNLGDCMTGILRSLADSPNLRKLQMAYCGLSLDNAALGALLAACPKIKTLDFQGNNHEGRSSVAGLVAGLRHLRKIRELRLFQTTMSVEGMEALGTQIQPARLRRLDVGFFGMANGLGQGGGGRVGRLPQSLGSTPRMTALNLSGNAVTLQDVGGLTTALVRAPSSTEPSQRWQSISRTCPGSQRVRLSGRRRACPGAFEDVDAEGVGNQQEHGGRSLRGAPCVLGRTCTSAHTAHAVHGIVRSSGPLRIGTIFGENEAAVFVVFGRALHS